MTSILAPKRPNFYHFHQKLHIFTKFWYMASYWRPKMTRFWPFSPKMTYFHNTYAINDIFDQIYVHKPDWNNFYKLLVKKLFYNFPQILTYDVILASKMTLFWPFSPKMTYLDKIDPINDISDPMLKFGESGQIIFFP